MDNDYSDGFGGVVRRLRLPEVSSDTWGKLGPGFGYGVGCGVGVGIGIVGGAGLGLGFPGVHLGIGFGTGCGVGLGFGYAAGKGRSYTHNGSFANFGGNGGPKRKFYKRRKENNPLSETALGRMIGDVFQDVASAVARLGRGSH
eukprot:TRINITY_DN20304_c0_g1_i1.p2 TRINITY_DN20304_c0_g1~~TRINITY_DN20304_c0_g1_i1.p2  ORF type:complete len:144 (+),score=14.72 TRINITY_DN20304_c0_g1_i1:128-559(+)